MPMDVAREVTAPFMNGMRSVLSGLMGGRARGSSGIGGMTPLLPASNTLRFGSRDKRNTDNACACSEDLPCGEHLDHAFCRPCGKGCVQNPACGAGQRWCATQGGSRCTDPTLTPLNKPGCYGPYPRPEHGECEARIMGSLLLDAASTAAATAPPTPAAAPTNISVASSSSSSSSSSEFVAQDRSAATPAAASSEGRKRCEAQAALAASGICPALSDEQQRFLVTASDSSTTMRFVRLCGDAPVETFGSFLRHVMDNIMPEIVSAEQDVATMGKELLKTDDDLGPLADPNVAIVAGTKKPNAADAAASSSPTASTESPADVQQLQAELAAVRESNKQQQQAASAEFTRELAQEQAKEMRLQEALQSKLAEEAEQAMSAELGLPPSRDGATRSTSTPETAKIASPVDAISSLPSVTVSGSSPDAALVPVVPQVWSAGNTAASAAAAVPTWVWWTLGSFGSIVASYLIITWVRARNLSRRPSSGARRIPGGGAGWRSAGGGAGRVTSDPDLADGVASANLFEPYRDPHTSTAYRDEDGSSGDDVDVHRPRLR